MQSSISTRLCQQSQDWLLPVLDLPDTFAVDATCGNGRDSLFLCERLGDAGRMIGFDVQEKALENTRQTLSACGFHPALHRVDHADFAGFFERNKIRAIHAAIFNLGYLPGGDHRLVTRADSTIPALRAILDRAAFPFRLAVVAYRGHPGGKEEASAVRGFLENADSGRFVFHRSESQNPVSGPVLFGLASRSDPENSYQSNE